MSIPPVYSKVRIAGLADAAALLARSIPAAELAKKHLGVVYPDASVVLTDSGTSALAMALAVSRSEVPVTVALPAFACPDVGAAAVWAGARIVQYDVDARTLEPVPASVERALAMGCTHLVVTHLYGRVLEIPVWKAMAARFGCVLVEDAAQHAGGTLNGQRSGGLADYGVLSFGRGKGINAGGGGALVLGPTVAGSVRDRVADLLRTSTTGNQPWRGAAQLVRVLATESLAQPPFYSLARRLPGLHIGETRYAALTEPGPMTPLSAVLLLRALEAEAEMLDGRRQRADWYHQRLAHLALYQYPVASTAVREGALRFPVRWPFELQRDALAALLSRTGLEALGVVPSYPRLLGDYAELRAHVLNPAAELSGARALAHTLLTLPTHALVTEQRAESIVDRLRSALSLSAGTPS